MPADDLASAVLFLLEHYDDASTIKLGEGNESIRELAGLGASVVGFTGRIEMDASKPDGTPRKQLDVSHLTALEVDA